MLYPMLTLNVPGAAACPEGDISRFFPQSMRPFLVAGASRSRPFSGHLAPSLLDLCTIGGELGRGGCQTVQTTANH